MVAFNGLLGGVTGGIGELAQGAGLATRIAVGAAAGAGGSMAAQEVFTGHTDWGQVALGAGIGGLASGVGAGIGAVRDLNVGPAAGKPVIVDTNAVLNRLFVEASLLPGEDPVMTQTTLAELKNLVARGFIKMPGYAGELERINDVMDVDTRINIRGMLEAIKPGQSGLFGDGSIGATAINTGAALLTADKNLTAVLRQLGVEVRWP